MELSLVFPCYREASHLEPNIDRVIRLLAMLDVEYEIVLVDDFSPDGTPEAIKALVARYPGVVRGIFHTKNEGRGGAFMTGFSATSGTFVGFFDIDCEVGPAYVVECLARLREGADLVIAKRVYRLHFKLLYRHILSSLYARAVVLLLRLPSGLDTESGYKFFRRDALEPYAGRFEHRGWFWDTEVVSRFIWDKRRVVTIPCAFVRNDAAVSTVRVLKDSIEYFRNLLRFRRAHRARIASESARARAIGSSFLVHVFGEITQAVLPIATI